MYNDNQSAYIYVLIVPDTTASLEHHYNINNNHDGNSVSSGIISL